MKNKKAKNLKTYTFSLKVCPDHLDALLHVNNVIYLKWVNEIAEKHWDVLSDSNLRKKYFWVCLRHEIDYLGQAILNDELTISTWVGDSGGVKSIRYVEIHRGEDIITRVKSTWCLINRDSKKPTRLKEDVLNVLKI